MVRDAVEHGGARLVVLDSITGYFASMPEGRFLLLQMHELLSYLAERGVMTVMTLAQTGIIGPMTAPFDVSYLADTVVLLRYYENEGRVRKAISVMKKRTGAHENAIRDVEFGSVGLRLGPPLHMLRGVLTGVPTLVTEPPRGGR
jgi:circadian clock protein KaiC